MDLLCLSIYPSECSLLLPLVEVSNASYNYLEKIAIFMQPMWKNMSLLLGNQCERICHSGEFEFLLFWFFSKEFFVLNSLALRPENSWTPELVQQLRWWLLRVPRENGRRDRFGYREIPNSSTFQNLWWWIREHFQYVFDRWRHSILATHLSGSNNSEDSLCLSISQSIPSMLLP